MSNPNYNSAMEKVYKTQRSPDELRRKSEFYRRHSTSILKYLSEPQNLDTNPDSPQLILGGFGYPDSSYLETMYHFRNATKNLRLLMSYRSIS